MNAKVATVVYVKSAPGLNPRSFALFRVMSRIGRSAAMVVNTIQTAQIVAHRAERYYAMNNSELARIGLTRDQIPAKLTRLFSELE